MSFPQSFVTEIPTTVAEEVLGYLADAPVSAQTRRWLSEIRQDVRDSQAQDSLMGIDG